MQIDRSLVELKLNSPCYISLDMAEDKSVLIKKFLVN